MLTVHWYYNKFSNGGLGAIIIKLPRTSIRISSIATPNTFKPKIRTSISIEDFPKKGSY